MEQENNLQPNNGDSLGSAVKNRKSKAWLWILLLLVIVGGAYAYYSSQKNLERDINLSPSEVEQLEGDDKDRVLQNQLQDLQNRAAALNDQSSQSDRFVVYIQLAEVQTALGNHDEAMAALDKIQQENLGNTRLWMTYAQVYKNKGDMAGARSNVDMAMKIDNGIADNWLFLFDVSKDLPREQQDAQFKAALTATENDAEIQAAYQKWQQENQQ